MSKLSTRERALASVAASLGFFGAFLLWPWFILALPVGMVALMVFAVMEDFNV